MIVDGPAGEREASPDMSLAAAGIHVPATQIQTVASRRSHGTPGRTPS